MRSASRFRYLKLALFVGLGLVACAAMAQNRPAAPRNAPQLPRAVNQNQAVPQRVTANRAVDQDASTRNTDQAIASMMALCNEQEVAQGKLAAAQTKDDKVKEFANMLAKEHAQAQDSLRPFGARFEPLSPDAGTRAEESPRAQDIAGQPQLETRQHGGINFLELEREVAQRCLQSAKRQWAENDPKEANECFVGMQIAGHAYAIDKLETLRGYASPALQQVIDKSLKDTQAHLDQAKDLIHQLVDSGRDSAKSATSDKSDKSETKTGESKRD